MEKCPACGKPEPTFVHCDRWDCPVVLWIKTTRLVFGDDLDSVNSDPDAELTDPEDDTIGGEWDEMADWPLEDEDEEDE